MLIAARQIMLGNKPPLPYDAEIEYIESTGTQWIDTGIVSQANLVYDFGLYETLNNNQRTFFGFAETTGSSWLAPASNLTNFCAYWYYINFANSNFLISNFNYPNRNGTHHYDFTDGNARATFNGRQIWTNNRTGSYTGERKVFIFFFDAASGTQTYNGQKRTGIGRISFFKISKNGVLLFDGIPVRVDTTGYMYDKVSGELFGNAGTGSFRLGPDKEN